MDRVIKPMRYAHVLAGKDTLTLHKYVSPNRHGCDVKARVIQADRCKLECLCSYSFI
jgi:hypothetical protein